MKQLQEVVEQPQLEKPRGDQVEASTHVETSSTGIFRAKWEEGAHAYIPPGRRWGDVELLSQESWNMGRILEAPNLFDSTLLWEPQRGVARLAEWVETDVDGAVKRAIVQESQYSVELVGCNNARGTGEFHKCRMAQRGVQRCEMHGVLQ